MNRPTPYVASLRIYQPIEAFSADQQRQWRALPATDTIAAEQVDALQRTIRPTSRLDHPVHLLEMDGTLLACPWTVAERCGLALATLRDAFPPAVLRLLLSAGVEPSGDTDAVPQILTETWVIPPRWFTLFSPEERLLVENDGGVSLRYLTALTNAQERAARHLITIRRAFGESSVTEENEAQARWLEEFHPDSLVELDYGGLARYLAQVLADEGGLEADSSVEDVLDSLDGLARGDGLAAGVGYQRLMGRWRRVAIFEHAS